MTEKIALQSVLDPRQVYTGILKSESPDRFLVVLQGEIVPTLFEKNGWKRVQKDASRRHTVLDVKRITHPLFSRIDAVPTRRDADNSQVLHVAAQIAKLSADLLTRLAQDDDKRCDSEDAYERGRVDGYEEALRDFSRSEPTDAEVLAALNAYTLCTFERLDEYGNGQIGAMQAALKAAFLAGQDQGPAANCAYCVGAGGYEDHDGSWVKCTCQYPESRNEQEENK